MKVYQIVLEAGTGNTDEVITVSLYSGETLSGECQSLTSSYREETLSCARVAADRVRLSVSSTWRTWLFVYDIRVTGALIETIGL